MRKTVFITLFFVLLTTTYNGIAQHIGIKGTANTDSIVIGQPFDYQLTLTIPKDYHVEWPKFDDLMSESVDVIESGEIDTTPINNSDVLMTQHLTLTSFDTGYVYVPEVGVTFAKSKEDSIRRTLYTDEVELFVSTVAVDTTQSFRPIRGIISQGYTFKEVILFVAIIVVFLGLVALMYYVGKKRKQEPIVVKEKPKLTIPAIVTARERLAGVKASEGWKTSKVKEYYTDITDIAREYLEGQFGIDAVEMTSDEIINSVKALSFNGATFNGLFDTLITADFVKFAKANPTAAQNEKAFKDVEGFVEESFVFFQEEERRKAEEAKNKKKADNIESGNSEKAEEVI